MDTEHWLSEYGDSQSRSSNRIMHWLAVPLVILGTVGLLWSLPVPQAFVDISPLLNWGITFLMAAEVYYFIISVSLAIGVLPLVIGAAALLTLLDTMVTQLLFVSLGAFALGTAGLYFSKGQNADLRGLLHNIQLIMIAPIWMLARLYRRVGIPY